MTEPQQVLMEKIKEFKAVQMELRRLQRELSNVSVAVKQSAALVALGRWVDKSDRLVQQLAELRA